MKEETTTKTNLDNGVLHWGCRIEVPRATDWEDQFVAVPVTLFRPSDERLMDCLEKVVAARENKTHRFSLLDVQELRTPDAPDKARWTAWVKVETR